MDGVKHMETEERQSKREPGLARKIFGRFSINVWAVAMAAAILLTVHGYTEEEMPVITIHAQRYQFAPSEITLTAGKPVKLVFIADDVAHGIAIDGLLPDRNINPGEPEAVILTPSTAGDFSGECSLYCGSGHERMKLSVHVIK
jgi:cytochrome c oxidase subunit 2